MTGTTYKPANLVVLPYPFSDALRQKKRPVLILTEPDGFGDFIGLAVTSKGHHEKALALNQENLLEGRLPKPSWIRTDKLFTLNCSLVEKSIGEVEANLFREARQAACATLGCYLTQPRTI